MSPASPQWLALIGTFRRFGDLGPVYDVLDIARSSPDESRMHIRVVESGEELDYPYSAIIEDPTES